MNRRSSLSTRILLAAVLLSGACTAVVHDAFAAPKDAAAQKLDKEAMDNDYLNVAFDKTSGKGTLTPGNSTPLTDGAASVLLLAVVFHQFFVMLGH